MDDRAISFNEAITRINTKAKRIENPDTLNGLAGAIAILYELPPVTPNEEEMTIKYIEGYNVGFCHAQAIFQKERPKGRWIKMPLVETGQTYSHKCSLCGRKILVTDVGLSEFPYCHCGARMEVEQNG